MSVDSTLPVSFWASKGLNLFACLDVLLLPEEISTHPSIARHRHWAKRLLLWGHGGTSMWSQYQRDKTDTIDTIDRWSQHTIWEGFGGCLDDARYVWIYPRDDEHAPLSQLGEYVGWFTPSLLGQGSHEEFGLWAAYRAVMVVDVAFPVTQRTEQLSTTPCERCAEKPCISVCPSQSVQPGGIHAELCMSYRMEEDSSCASRCFSRYACPVGRRHQYTQAQSTYHAHHSLEAIRSMLMSFGVKKRNDGK